MTYGGSHRSLWLDDELQPLVTDAVSVLKTRRCDVVIVGAGIVGLTAAISLLQSGRSVCVLEARQVGQGTSVHATAKVTSSHGSLLAQIADRRGISAAVEYQESNDAGFTWLAGLVEGVEESVEWNVAEHLVYGSDDDALRQNAAIASVAGAAAKVSESPFWTGEQAMTWGHCALVHPAKLLRFLADEARRRGAVLVEHARVQQVRSNEIEAEVRLEGGQAMRCKHVVLATQLPISDPELLVPRLDFTWHAAIAVHSGSRTVPTSISIDEDGMSTRPVRLADGLRGAVIVGPRTSPDELTSGLAWDELESRAARLMGTGTTVCRWSAHDACAPGLLPLLRHRPGQLRVWTITGMNGWGFTNAAALALTLPSVLRHPEEATANGSLSAHGALQSSRTLASSGLRTAKALLGGHARSFGSSRMSSIPVGTGVVVGGPVNPQAVSRTADGVIHSVSARCTHAGCIVDWNLMAQAWECPCHGSMFEPDGQVLCGPASKPLPPSHDRVEQES